MIIIKKKSTKKQVLIPNGFKVFDENWQCREFQYEVGKTYSIPENEIKICQRGFHYCEKLVDCFNWKDFNPKNKIAAIYADKKIIKDKNKNVCSQITIIKEISWETMLTIVNLGSGNSGYINSGNNNSGDNNSGDNNSGNINSGNNNSGNNNSGDNNSGDNNSGDNNSGYNNSGDNNSGSWNQSNYETGYFNTLQPITINVFNKPCSIDIWNKANKPKFLYFNLNIWIDFNEMTDVEKKNNPKAETSGGYLKKREYKAAFQTSYAEADQGDKDLLWDLPNFDPDVFFEISGIRVQKRN